MIFIFSIILFWGGWGFTEKVALFHGSPYQTLFAFYVWTALLFLPVAIFLLYKNQGRGGFKISSKVWFWIVVAVLSDLAAVLAIRFAMLKAPAGVVIAAISSYPIITALLSWKFLNEKITKQQFAGIIVVCIGLILLGS